jgi:hypothetical protein
MVETALSVRIRPRLLVVWIALGVLVAGAVVIEFTDRSPAPGAEQSADALLAIPLDHVDAVEVGHAGAMHRFERDHDGAWFYHGTHASSEAAHDHHADPAKAELITKAFAGLARARIERRLALDAGSTQYGFASPRMLIVIYRANESRPFAQYAIGDVAPDSFSRYVQKAGSTEAVTIANYQVENLVKLIEAMRN